MRSDYQPAQAAPEPFQEARLRFAAGRDTPGDYLERCLRRLDEREAALGAFVSLDLPGARRAAAAAGERYRQGRPLSEVDGMPIGVKDVIETATLPTQMGSPLFKGWGLGRNAACVAALVRGGAVIIGKTVTTEFAVGSARQTTNPWDAARTPGGSSSGSGAAVAAGIVAAALGTQEIGSLIRPASFCGVIGYKPSFGSLHQGGVHGVAPSQSHLGIMAGSLGDLWAVARQLAHAAGGDPGHPALSLPDAPIAPTPPRRVGMLRTSAWPRMDAGAAAAFEALVRRVAKTGAHIEDASGAPELAAFEREAADALDIWATVCLWELRWPLAGYRDRDPDAIGADTLRFIDMAERLTAADYDRACARREALRAQYQALSATFDGLLLPAATGPAPLGLASTGSRDFNAFSSGLGAPAVSLPLLAHGGLPFGVQWMGFARADAAVAGHVQWLAERLAPALA